MSGRLTVRPKLKAPSPKFEKHDHVIFETADHVITYNDPRRFGLVLLVPTQDLPGHPLFKNLGPEPLDPSFTGAVLRQKLKGKKAALKVTIMDQRVVVGVGNIYASEALFRAKLNPKKKAGSLTAAQAETLVAAIKAVLNDAIKAGGSSLRDYRHGDGQLGYFQHNFQVYGRKGEPCPVCGTPIKQAVMGQRSTYWCPHCQKG